MRTDSRILAILRIGLGLGQVMGATAILFLYFKAGLSNITIGVAIVTLCIMIASRFIFAKGDGNA